MLELQLIDDDHEPSGVSLPAVDPEYTQEVVDRALRLARKGNRVVTACRVCGISEALYEEWCELHPEFAWAVLVAEAEAEAAVIDMIDVHMKGIPVLTTKTTEMPDGSRRVEVTETIKSDLSAARYLLERRFGDGWRLRGASAGDGGGSDGDGILVTYVDDHAGALGGGEE